MDDLHTFAAKLLDLDPDQVQPCWELVGLMYRLIQLQHRAIGFTLDRLQMHGPSGHTFAAMHSVTLQLNALRAAYAARLYRRPTGGRRRQTPASTRSPLTQTNSPLTSGSTKKRPKPPASPALRQTTSLQSSVSQLDGSKPHRAKRCRSTSVEGERLMSLPFIIPMQKGSSHVRR